MSGETVGGKAVTLGVGDWQLLVGVMDNEISSAVTEMDTEDIVEAAQRVRESVCSRAAGSDGYFLPGDQQVSVALAVPDWSFVTRTLSHWADIADGMTPGVDPDGTEVRELSAAISSQLSG